MNVLWISLKNVINAKRRSLFTFAILSFGAMIYIITTLMIDSLLNLSLQETIKEETADIRVQSLTYDEELPFSTTNLWVHDTKILEGVLGMEHTPRLIIEADIDNYQDSLPIMLMGIDPITDRAVFELPTKIDTELEDGIAWLGVNLAESLKVMEGDYINLTFRTLEGGYVSAEYEVGNLLTSGNPQLSEMGVVVSIHELQSLLETNVITYLSIKADDSKQLPTLIQGIKKRYPNQKVRDKKDMLSQTIESLAQRRKFTNVYIFMILVITLMGIANTIFISVWEKRRLTGTLRAIGYDDRSIMLLFIFEGAWTGILGSLLGIVFAMIANIPLSIFGIDIMELMKIGGRTLDVGFYIPPTIKTNWNILTFLTPLVLTPVAAMLVSLAPAYKSIKMPVIDCIRNLD